MAGTLPEMLDELKIKKKSKDGCAQRASKLRMECPK